jgi:uncharacterized protein (DUF362 family)
LNYQFKDVEKVIVDIASVKRPELIIIDSSVAMEKEGQA